MSGYLFNICSVTKSFDEPYIVDQSIISSATASLSLFRLPKMSAKNLWLAILLFNLSSIPVIMLSLVALPFFTRNDSIFFFDTVFPPASNSLTIACFISTEIFSPSTLILLISLRTLYFSYRSEALGRTFSPDK